MPGGYGILVSGGQRRKVTPQRMADLENYVFNLAKNSLQMDADGDVDIIGVINVGLAGGFFQGIGTFASPTTGLKIYNSGGVGLVGLLEMGGSGTKQAYMDTDGKLYAGAGTCMLDATGLNVKVSVLKSDTTAYRFVDSASPTTMVSMLTATYVAGVNVLFLESEAISAADSTTYLIARSPANKTAYVTMSAISGAAPTVSNVVLRVQAAYGGTSDVTITGGGLNVGTATGAGEGDIHLNDTLRVGAAAKNISIFATGAGEDIASSNTLHLNYSNNQTVAIGAGGTSALTVSGSVTLAAGSNLVLATTTGTKIGTGTTQLLGFWNTNPAVQPAAVADASGGATIDAEARTAINTLLARLRTVGIIAT